jgi:photosystem II stability/assembly factor-like uncharacterized protein
MRTFYLYVLLPALMIAAHAALQAQWIKQPFPSTEVLYKVLFADAQTGWILGASNLYKTSDGGLSWTPQKSTTGYGQALHVLNNDIVFHANFNSVLERSTDGGTTWSVVDSSMTAYFDFDFVTPLVGYAAGGEGSPMHAVLRKTTDAGATWTAVASSFSEGEIEGVSFVEENSGWAVSYWGLMYKTTNGGLAWTFQDTVGRANFGFNAPVRDVQFTTLDSGWAVGGLSANNVIARTTNGGSTWAYLTPGGSSWREVHMRNSQRGWIVGATYTPFVARTTNGGESWEGQTFSTPPNPTRGLESICMIDDNLGWAVGGFGDVFKTTNGGDFPLPVLDTTEPHEFHLAQNYPNPFNPSTTFTFAIPYSIFVILKVYDVLGREVSILVNEVKEPGRHEVVWNAQGMASGMYLYRLQAGGFVQTRKMLLLR